MYYSNERFPFVQMIMGSFFLFNQDNSRYAKIQEVQKTWKGMSKGLYRVGTVIQQSLHCSNLPPPVEQL